MGHIVAVCLTFPPPTAACGACVCFQSRDMVFCALIILIGDEGCFDLEHKEKSRIVVHRALVNCSYCRGGLGVAFLLIEAATSEQRIMWVGAWMRP